MQRTRRAVADIGAALEAGRCSLIDDIEPQPFGHPWDLPTDTGPRDKG
jgi:hypothetical protein